MRAVKNCLFTAKIVWRYAPLQAVIFTVSQLIPATFTGLQLIMQQLLVDSACAWAQGAGAVEPVAVWGGSYVVMLILWVTIQRVGSYQSRLIDLKLMEQMASDIVARLMKLEYADFERQGTQELFQRMSREPYKMIADTFRFEVMSLHGAVSVIFAMSAYFTISPWIGMGTIFVGVPMMFFAWQSAYRARLLHVGTTDEKRRLGDLKQLLVDKNAMYEMKLFSAEKMLTDKWMAYSRALERKNWQEGKRMAFLNVASCVLRIVYFMFMTAALGYGFLQGEVSLGQFTAALNNVYGVCGKIGAVGRDVSQLFQNAMLLDFYRDFESLPERKDLGRNGESGDSGDRDIVFEHVSFRYPDTDREILHNVSFRIREGEHIAFVGENGAGKSTLIKLLLGLYEPSEGRITIGGVSVRDLTEEARRRLMAVVFQDFCRYQMTLRENVAFGGIGALEDDERLLSALNAADSMELVENAAKGLDRNLGKLEEDGQDLSDGQWQRVAMARAFVSKSDYVILDEPTASLDPIAESRMYENFSQIFSGKNLARRGVIMISHRLASARLADRILVLDGGRIVQDGNHEELMAQEGLYRIMYSAQSFFYVSQTEAEAAAAEPARSQGQRACIGKEAEGL